MSKPKRVAVIGGGLSGLAAAHRLVELDPSLEVVVLEAGGRLGGVVRTESQDGFLLELSADSFITATPAALDLCRRLGLADELLETNPLSRKAFIVRRGRLYQVPEGFALMSPRRVWPLLASRLLSLRGKLRLLGEYFVRPAQGEGDESLASFARRRLGNEAFERLVQPLVGGIYTADAEQLSLAATLPRFMEMERRHGGLIRGARHEAASLAPPQRAASGARYSLFVTPRRGLSSLVEALAARLPAGAVRLNSPVEAIETSSQHGWSLQLGNGQGSLAADGLIVAVPAYSASILLAKVDSELANCLGRIPYAGAAIALAGFDRSQIARPLRGAGFVVPEVEHRHILSCSYSSEKFSGRAPEGKVLLRVFLGGAKHPEMMDLPDDEIRRIVAEELGELLGVRGDPLLFRVARWPRAMPQYHVGHLDMVARIEGRLKEHSHLALAGNAYRGVGLPHCIESGEKAAETFMPM